MTTQTSPQKASQWVFPRPLRQATYYIAINDNPACAFITNLFNGPGGCPLVVLEQGHLKNGMPGDKIDWHKGKIIQQLFSFYGVSAIILFPRKTKDVLAWEATYFIPQDSEIDIKSDIQVMTFSPNKAEVDGVGDKQDLPAGGSAIPEISSGQQQVKLVRGYIPAKRLPEFFAEHVEPPVHVERFGQYL